MIKDMVFFGEKGLTTTSANHIANMAKEYIEEKEAKLSNISFVTESIKLIDSVNGNLHILSHESNESTFNSIEKELKNIADATSLISWLREAIKAKEMMMESIKKLDVKTYVEEILNLEYPKLMLHPKPKTADFYVSQLSVDERCRFYENQSASAVFGKYIHKNGAFSKARKEYIDKTQSPNVLVGTGKDSMIKNYTSRYDNEEIENTFFALQNIHRNSQATTNKMLYDIDLKVRVSTDIYNADNVVSYDKYTALTEKYSLMLKKYIEEEKAIISDYKIIIPSRLTAIYDLIRNLVK